ncbi:MAG: hypothetical protein QM831_31575 [Kofleriaceae bacterium]
MTRVGAPYTLEIFIEPIKGTRPIRFKSSYLILRRDGTKVKDCPFINNDPKGLWAEVDARGAIDADAGYAVKKEEVIVTVMGAQ